MSKSVISSQSINKYRKELEEIFKDVEGKQRYLLEIQIERVSFMMAQCDELEKIIKREGSVELYENGKQKMMREHPASKSYTSVTKSLLSYLEKMKLFIPEEKKKSSAMDEFLNKRNKQAG